MKTIVPDYYAGFACLMGACRHSCCIGWEIDIDSETLEYYRSIPGDLKQRIDQNILPQEEGACFRLTQEKRCPFLNREGLCDLILELGEESLCQICADHPRFRNFFSDREEVGLGLCCEGAAHLILAQEEPASLLVQEDDGEEEELYPDEEDLLDMRNRLIFQAQDRSLTMKERIARIREIAGIDMPAFEKRAEFLLGLERLDEEWTLRLQALAARESDLPELCEKWEIPLEQLLVYLLYRHLPGALDDGDLSGRIAFILFSWQLVRDLFALCGNDARLDALEECARLYSSEIEYSDENIGAIIDALRLRQPGL